MTLVWVFFFLVFVVISLGIHYKGAKGTIEREVAQTNLRSIIFWFLPLFAIVFLIFRKYGTGGYMILSSIISVALSILIGVWLLSWIFQKQKAGGLLLDIGRNPQSKFMLWLGLFQAAIAAVTTLVLCSQVSQGFPPYMSLEGEVLRPIYYWSVAIYLIMTGLSRLEFRENGICFMCSTTAWRRVNSYQWEQTKPNILTIRLKPRLSFFQGIMSMSIPAKHRDAVSQILNERLPAQNQNL